MSTYPYYLGGCRAVWDGSRVLNAEVHPGDQLTLDVAGNVMRLRYPVVEVRPIQWVEIQAAQPISKGVLLCLSPDGAFSGWIGAESGGSVLGVTHWADTELPGGAQ